MCIRDREILCDSAFQVKSMAASAYEDVYGSQYNYGGPNVVDYQIPELEFGAILSR